MNSTGEAVETSILLEASAIPLPQSPSQQPDPLHDAMAQQLDDMGDTLVSLLKQRVSVITNDLHLVKQMNVLVKDQMFHSLHAIQDAVTQWNRAQQLEGELKSRLDSIQTLTKRMDTIDSCVKQMEHIVDMVLKEEHPHPN